MKPTVATLPPEIRNEYERRNAVLFRSRVELYILLTTGVYFLVSLQYLFRKTVLLKDTFRSWELTLWAILMAGMVLAMGMNRRGKTRRSSKIAALVFTGFFLWAFSGLAAVYPETGLVFVFYFAFAQLFTCVLIPWTLSEVLWLSLLYAAAFVCCYDYVTLVMRYQVTSLPRFEMPFDGLVFMVITAIVSVIVRRKEIDRDLHNFVLLKQVESQHAQMDRELELARRVHMTLVPDSLTHERADVWVSYIPMSYVSGDYAKVRFIDPDRLLVFISDVTGHGVAAALLVNRVHAEFERLILDRPEPGELLRRLNAFILRDFEGTSMYLSAFCGLLDFRTQRFIYSNYGHPPQLILRPEAGQVRMLDSQNTLLGISGVPLSAAQGEISFAPGDRLLLFTDGVVEATDPQGRAFGEVRLREFLQAHDGIEGAQFNERLVGELTRFRNGAFTDDIYILNIKTKASQLVGAGKGDGLEADLDR